MKFIVTSVVGFLAILHLANASELSSIPVWETPIVKEWLQEMRGNSGSPTAETLVTIKNGTIRGNTANAVGSNTMYQYLGIPYAKAPVGELRFQPPVHHDGWGEGILEATKQPHACPQYLTNLTEADENCLYLSVYSRRNASSTGALLPVIYFIHGGGFALGQSSSYTGSKLLAEEVVLVTVQYRLGTLGFLYLEDDSVSGNNAMKDQVLGLKWVQENIEAFGGDPKQVTVMGESAGSASALYHLISPMSKGLYSKVVAMSGTPLQEWAIDRNPLQSAKRIGALLNCTTDSNPELLACLKGQHWSNLTKAGLAVNMEDFQDFKILLSGTTPVIEGNVPGAFLPDEPLTLMLEGDLPDVPLLLGTVQHEGALPLVAAYYLTLGPTGLVNDTKYVRDFLLGDMLSTYGVNERRDGASVSQAMGVGYFHKGQDRSNFTDVQYEIMDMLTAVFMKGPVLRTADILSRRLPAVYLYSFEHYSQRNSLYHLVFAIVEPILGGKKPPLKPGIMHADDLIYMFSFPFVLSANDVAFSRMYCQLFTNFVTYGTPTPEATDLYPIWPAYNLDTVEYMELNLPPAVKTDFTSSWRKGMPGGNGPV